MASKRVHLVISGYVQGVWFRASAQEEARRCGVFGWVRNRGDGSVEAVAEGEEADLAEFIRWCHQGPEGAQVENVDVTWGSPTGEFPDFQIRR